ncbi:transcriptional regulator [Chryseobacterium sp. FH2]|nr:transcriptional regulator [Chryseobacterium sp. FH2]
MNKEYLSIAIIDDNNENVTLFKNILNKIKIGVKIQVFQSIDKILDYLNSGEVLIPEIMFINFNVFERKILDETRNHGKFDNLVTALYSEKLSESEIEDFFVNGGNIFIRKPDNEVALKKVLSDVITVNWQYHTSGLNKDNFILKIL